MVINISGVPTASNFKVEERESSFTLKTEAADFSETYLPDHTKSHQSSNGPTS
jgi:hypothetical protein